MAAKKTARAPATLAPVPAQRKPLSKSWVTSDDALTFILTADVDGQEVCVEDDEDGGSVQLAVEIEQIDEVIKILTEMKNTAIRYRKGEDIPSDPIDEDEDEEDDGESEEDDLEDEEDDEDDE